MVDRKFAVIDKARLHVGGDEAVVGARRQCGDATDGEFVVHIFYAGDGTDRVSDFQFHLLARHFTGEQHREVEAGHVDVGILEALYKPPARFPFDIFILDINARGTAVTDHQRGSTDAGDDERNTGLEEECGRQYEHECSNFHLRTHYISPNIRLSMASQRQCSVNRWTS